jgi:two-component system sensor histidine kinase/response regulator
MQETDPERTILIVEDDRSMAEALRETLDREGLRTVVIHDGKQALSIARLLQPDVILLDVVLPGMSGIELCKTLKSDPSTAAIAVIFITAHAHHAIHSQAICAGANAYLLKPFSPIELIDLVDMTLDGQSVAHRRHFPDLTEVPADQLVIFARELNRLYERERRDRQAIETAHSHLEELARSKAAFLGAVTHELLTPFAKIGLPMQVLLRQGDALTPEQQTALEDMTNEIAQLHQMISGLVKFAGLVNRQRDPQPGHIALDSVIPAAVQPVAVLAQARDVDFRLFVPLDLPKVYADPELVSEAIFQMSHNAVKFNQPGGQAQVRVFESSSWVVTSAQDTGVGLSPERVAVLGKPFEQSAHALRRGQEGLGIGWAFVCYVAEAHRGRTFVESSGPGKGSTFSLALPADTHARGPVNL